MALITATPSVFSPLSTHYLGFDRFFDDVDRMLTLATSQALGGGFPPMNLYRVKDGYVIEMAVAGFKHEDITVQHDERTGTLSIWGDNGPKAKPAPTADTDTATAASGTQYFTNQVGPGEVEVKSSFTAPPDERMLIKQGIANRNFSRSFTVSEELEVATAALDAGLLTIALRRKAPPVGYQPRRVEIE